MYWLLRPGGTVLGEVRKNSPFPQIVFGVLVWFLETVASKAAFHFWHPAAHTIIIGKTTDS